MKASNPIPKGNIWKMRLRHRIPYYVNHTLTRFKNFILPPFPVSKITADFYISMGGDCRTATQLRRNRLRICASPLDWMRCYSLADAATLFEIGFETFFSDIQELPHENGSPNRTVVDARNGMQSIHHFPVSVSLEEGRKAYREKSARHFKNTHFFMSNAEHCVMVTNRAESMENICAFIRRMKALYRARLTHINVRNSGEGGREIVAVCDGAELHDYSFDDVNFNEKRGLPDRRLLGNDPEWRRILGACRRTALYTYSSSESIAVQQKACVASATVIQ